MVLPMAKRRVIILNDERLFVRAVNTHWTRKHRIHSRCCCVDEGSENALASRFNSVFRVVVIARNRVRVRSCRANGRPPAPHWSMEAMMSSSISNTRSEPTTKPTLVLATRHTKYAHKTLRIGTYRFSAANPWLHARAACT